MAEAKFIAPKFTRAELEAIADPIERLRALMAALRDPKRGCPWDLEQTFESIAPYTIEEAYEVRDAIHGGDRAALRDELGDLLLQAVYHAQLAQDEGSFTLDDVAVGITDKMIRRHPHVFDRPDDRTAEAQVGMWEQQKAAERATKAKAKVKAKASAGGTDGADGVDGALDGIAGGLPALMHAEKLQKRAARVGFDWPDAGGVYEKLDEEIAELHAAETDADRAEELGDLLFTVVNLARKLKIDPEEALRLSNDKFERRFRAMEAEGPLEGCDLDALEARWQRAKTADNQRKGSQAKGKQG